MKINVLNAVLYTKEMDTWLSLIDFYDLCGSSSCFMTNEDKFNYFI